MKIGTIITILLMLISPGILAYHLFISNVGSWILIPIVLMILGFIAISIVKGGLLYGFTCDHVLWCAIVYIIYGLYSAIVNNSVAGLTISIIIFLVYYFVWKNT